jgi:deoxyribonuclease V
MVRVALEIFQSGPIYISSLTRSLQNMQTNLKTYSFTSPTSVAEAIAIQKQLRNSVRLKDEFSSLRVLAGIDVSYDKQADLTKAFIVLMSFDHLLPLKSVTASLPTSFPYVPGLLSFREIPAILQVFQQLGQIPDLLMVDGQGIAHPRRLGIAAHLGVILDIPAIGVAKSRLTGSFKTLGAAKGSITPLMDKTERIGTVLRAKEKCNPLFISPGHRVSHESAVNITLHCLTRYRLPEPTRIADKLSKIKEPVRLL